MSKLTYLGVTHVSPTADLLVPYLPLRKGEHVKLRDLRRDGRAADTACGRFILVGSAWLRDGVHCAHLPQGAHWRKVHTFKVG